MIYHDKRHKIGWFIKSRQLDRLVISDLLRVGYSLHRFGYGKKIRRCYVSGDVQRCLIYSWNRGVKKVVCFITSSKPFSTVSSCVKDRLPIWGNFPMMVTSEYVRIPWILWKDLLIKWWQNGEGERIICGIVWGRSLWEEILEANKRRIGSTCSRIYKRLQWIVPPFTVCHASHPLHPLAHSQGLAEHSGALFWLSFVVSWITAIVIPLHLAWEPCFRFVLLLLCEHIWAWYRVNSKSWRKLTLHKYMYRSLPSLCRLLLYSFQLNVGDGIEEVIDKRSVKDGCNQQEIKSQQ